MRADLGLVIVAGLLMSSCSVRLPELPGTKDGAPAEKHDFSSIPDAVPRAEKRSRYGNPASYVVHGKRYHTLNSAAGFNERGVASWYGTKFHGRRTSSGEPYDMYTMTAAHKSLPLPTYVRVRNLENGRSVIVKVNDRGPFHENRIIDLSYAAAGKLGVLAKGTALVEVTAIDSAQPTKIARAAPADVKPEPAPRIFLQVGAFGSERNAKRLQQRLETELQRAVRIEGATNHKGRIWRVQVGPLASVDRADAVTLELHRAGITEPRLIIR